MNSRIITAMLAIASAASLTAPASAQRYFMRERIQGIETSKAAGTSGSSQYSGSWTTTNGSTYCSGTDRLQNVTVSCSNGSCDPATKPSSAAVSAGTCSATCETTFVAGKWGSGGSSSTGIARNDAEALDYCKGLKKVGICGYYTSNTTVYFWNGQTTPDSQSTTLKALVCRLQ